MRASEATKMVAQAIRKGELIRPGACSRCGVEGRVEGHHYDYSRPLDVEWLCCPCHNRVHSEAGPIWTGRDPEDPSTTQISARIPTALIDRLAAIAKSEDRTVSAEIRRALERHIRENEGATA